MKKKTILITGSSGFIGYLFLKRSLEDGYKIIDILRDKNKKNKKLLYLRKKYKFSYKSIFFSDLKTLKNKLNNKKIDYFINFATLYKNSHSHDDIPNFINSNVLFPVIITDIIFRNVKKIINFGTMMQHVDGKNYDPKNFYASTKSAFEMILQFYTSQNKTIKFYNLKFYESFDKKDSRKKLIPQLLKNFKKNLITKIISKRLELNIIHTQDIFNSIKLILNRNIKSGTYCLKSKKNVNIFDLIKNVNKNSKKKIKVKYLSQSMIKPNRSMFKILPKWRPMYNIQKEIEKNFYENN